jgi:hypothetical protein
MDWASQVYLPVACVDLMVQGGGYSECARSAFQGLYFSLAGVDSVLDVTARSLMSTLGLPTGNRTQD